MISRKYFRKAVSIDRIRAHIRALEGVRHPQAAPESLDRAADYITESLATLGFEMEDQIFQDNGKPYSQADTGDKH